MTDESSDNGLGWWMPDDRPDPAEHEDIIELGRVDATRPIGPMSLRNPSRRPYVLAGVAVAALLAGGGAALAVGSSATPASARNAVTDNPVPVASAGAAGSRHYYFHTKFGRGMFGMVHGQFVIAKSGGGYQTIDEQDGQVTAVSTTSITLKSSDGFTKTYVVTSSTTVDAQRSGIGSVKVGNQASVLATVSGSTVTATNIADLSLLRQGHPGSRGGQGSGAGSAQPG